MIILIKRLEDAKRYEPRSRTYAIRIKSSFFSDEDFGTLSDSSNYEVIQQYVFDDVKDKIKRPSAILFDETIAEKLLLDFKQQWTSEYDLLVHCTNGLNRAPAIGLGLNQVFNLGLDVQKFMQEYQYGSWWMSNILIETAQRLKFEGSEKLTGLSLLKNLG